MSTIHKPKVWFAFPAGTQFMGKDVKEQFMPIYGLLRILALLDIKVKHLTSIEK